MLVIKIRLRGIALSPSGRLISVRTTCKTDSRKNRSRTEGWGKGGGGGGGG
jgi:hypothetical protein